MCLRRKEPDLSSQQNVRIPTACITDTFSAIKGGGRHFWARCLRREVLTPWLRHLPGRAGGTGLARDSFPGHSRHSGWFCFTRNLLKFLNTKSPHLNFVRGFFLQLQRVLDKKSTQKKTLQVACMQMCEFFCITCALFGVNYTLMDICLAYILP